MPADPAPSPFSAGALLRDIDAHRLADHIVDAASARAQRPVALYVVDIGGSELRRVAGHETLPHRLPVPRCIGPEIARDMAGELAQAVRDFDGSLHVVPLWLRHRAIAAIVCAAAPVADLDDLAREAAAAIELIDGYTDQFAAARRLEPVSTPAQLQQDLLPPRIAAGRGAELAACILPAYDVGGDWFDHAVSDTGAWLALGDAMGKGFPAAASSALAVSAQRAVRQSGGTLADAAWAIHDAVSHAGGGEAFMTVVLAQWDARDHTLSWINCGHPSPVLRRRGAPLGALNGPRTLPLGIADLPPKIRLAQERLQADDQVLIYSDGVSERRLADGQVFGVAGIAGALQGAGDSATAAVGRVQRAVMAASSDDLSDDATLLALKVLADDQREPPTPGAESRRR